MDLRSLLIAEAQAQGVDPNLALGILNAETGGHVDPANAVSKAGAIGPMQLMPGTAKDLGVNPYDPTQNIRGGVTYLKQMLTQFGDPQLAVAAYNAGPGNVRKAGGVPNITETKNYVRKVTGGNMPTEQEILQYATQGGKAPAKGAGPTEQDILDFAVQNPQKQQAAAPAPAADDNGWTSPSAWLRQGGLAARALAQGVSDPFVAINDLALEYVQNPIQRALGFTPTQARMTAARDSAIDAVLPTPATPYERIGNMGGRAVASLFTPVGRLGSPATTSTAVGAGAAGAGTQAVRESPVYQDLSPGAQMAVDLGVGTVAGVGTSYGVNKAVNAVRGNLQGDAAAVRDAATKEGVNVRAGDLSGPGSRLSVAEDAAVDMPFSGGRQFMDAQATQVRQMFTNLERDFRPAGVGQSGTTATADRIIANDMRTNYEANKRVADSLFRSVPQNETVLTANTATTAKNLLTQYPDALTTLQASRNLRDSLDRIAAATAPNSRTMGAVTFGDIRRLSKDVGSLVAATRSDQKLTEIHGALSKLYGAIQQDVDQWAATTANKTAADNYTKAMTYFRENVGPYRDSPQLRKILSSRENGADFDEGSRRLFESVFSSGDTETANLALRLMSDKGKEAVGYKVVQRAVTPAVSGALNAGVSNAKFLNGLRLDDPVTQAILQANPALAKRLEGVFSVADATRRAPQAAANPRTGARMLPLGAGSAGAGVGAAVGGIPGAILGAVAPTLMSRGLNALSQSRIGQNLLLAKPGANGVPAAVAPYQALQGLLADPNRQQDPYGLLMQ